jgi:hypothetical protein
MLSRYRTGRHIHEVESEINLRGSGLSPAVDVESSAGIGLISSSSMPSSFVVEASPEFEAAGVEVGDVGPSLIRRALSGILDQVSALQPVEDSFRAPYNGSISSI